MYDKYIVSNIEMRLLSSGDELVELAQTMCFFSLSKEAS
jgi:hypothetical protein